MTNYEFECPYRLNDQNTINFLNRLYQYRDKKHVKIFFSTINFVFPFATLLLAECLRDFLAYRREIGLQTNFDTQDSDFRFNDAISYLQFFGFFKFINLQMGNEPNSKPPGDTYIPIRFVRAEELESRDKVIQEAIQQESENIASIMVDDISENIMLKYCFREIIRNVFEHSNAGYCTVMGQKWLRGNVAGDVEIAIVDKGIGIHGSMSQTYEKLTVEMSIDQALQPGISRVTEPQKNNEWDNTGFGLFILSTLGERYGDFSLCSNGKLYSPNQDSFQDVHFNGTAIKLRVNLEYSGYFPNILRQIVNEGERIYHESTGSKKTASKSSSTIPF